MPPKKSRQLNPAFAAAHGLSANLPKSQFKTQDTNTCNNESNSNRLERALSVARSTGKFNLSNIGLSGRLPDAIFDLQSGIKVDLSLDSSSAKSWEIQTEETLSLVDFSDNPIGGSLDERIGRYVRVATLRARRCELVDIPLSVISSLQQLRTLDLRANGLTFLPLELLPDSIRDLDVSSNKISSLTGEKNDSAVACLPNLINLDVSHNCLTKMPAKLQLESLKHFKFGHNKVEEIPSTFMSAMAQSLATLEGNDNNLKAIPDLGAFDKLTVLNLSQNQLVQPPAIPPSLVRLVLDSNLIESLKGLLMSDAMVGLNLTDMLLGRNQLTSIDTEILSRLLKLKILDLKDNNINNLPPVLGYLPNVHQVVLDGNPLRRLRSVSYNDTEALLSTLRKRGGPPPGDGYLPQEFSDDWPPSSDIGTEDAKKALDSKTSVDVHHPKGSILASSLIGNSVMTLENKGLSEIPCQTLKEVNSSIRDHLKTLKVNGNKVQSLPEELISLLPSLTTLEASKNQLTSLPQDISQWRLSIFLLNTNQLTSTVVSSVNLGHTLTHLDLSNNQLRYIPALGKLPELHTLNLSFNAISSVSTDDGRRWEQGVPALANLDLSNNRITDLEDFPLTLAACCPKLKSLQLSNNELRRLPPSLCLLEDLQAIDLRGNPQRLVRYNVLEKSCKDILTYLRNRMSPSELEESKQRIGEIADSLQEVGEAKGGEGKLDTRDTKSSTSKTGTEQETKITSSTSPLAEELRVKIDELSSQLNNVSLSQAKKYALKKSLAMERAKLIREERRLKLENS